MLPTERVILVGQGGRDDIEDALVHQAKALGFEVVVVDPMPDLREAPDAIVKSAVIDPKTFSIGNRDSVVVLTKGERDVDILESLSKTNARFVGLLASRRRLRKDMEELGRRAVPHDFLSRLHAQSAWTLALGRLRSWPWRSWPMSSRRSMVGTFPTSRKQTICPRR